MKAGRGTNSITQLLALWGFLYLSKACRFEKFLIVGDSQVIIGWAIGEPNFHSPILDHWKMKFQRLISSFTCISFKHIFQERNVMVDRLSKVGRGDMDGLIHFEVWKNSTLSSSGCLDTS